MTHWARTVRQTADFHLVNYSNRHYFFHFSGKYMGVWVSLDGGRKLIKDFEYKAPAALACDKNDRFSDDPASQLRLTDVHAASYNAKLNTWRANNKPLLAAYKKLLKANKPKAVLRNLWSSINSFDDLRHACRRGTSLESVKHACNVAASHLNQLAMWSLKPKNKILDPSIIAKQLAQRKAFMAIGEKSGYLARSLVRSIGKFDMKDLREGNLQKVCNDIQIADFDEAFNRLAPIKEPYFVELCRDLIQDYDSTFGEIVVGHVLDPDCPKMEKIRDLIDERFEWKLRSSGQHFIERNHAELSSLGVRVLPFFQYVRPDLFF